MWKATRKLNHPKVSQPPIKNGDGKWARSNKEKADVFAGHLANVFTPWPSNNENFDSEIERFLNTPHQMSLPISSFKICEIEKMIKHKINQKKASGFDLISGKVLSEISPTVFDISISIKNEVLLKFP